MFRKALILMLVGLSLAVAACSASTPTASQPAPTALSAPTSAAPAPTTTRLAVTTAPTQAQPTVTAPAPTTAPTTGSTATQPPAPTAAPQATATTGQTAASATTAVKKFNLNTASANDFLTVPGVGERMLREFQEYKPYSSILQFRREIGKYVNAQQVAEYEKYVYVPINVNQADAATLQQLPGLDANEAAALIAGRPYASADAFFAKLAPYVSPDELALAKTYVSAP